MATRPAVTTQVHISREALSAALGGRVPVVRAIEDLLRDVSTTLPDASQANSQAAQDALDAANNAQGSADALATVQFITLALSGLTQAERQLVVDGKTFTLTDAGPNSTLTLASADLLAVLASDFSESAGTFANVPGMALNLAAGATYLVEGLLTAQSAAVTTGLALGFTLPAGAQISGSFAHNISATALEGSYNIGSGAVKGNTSAALVINENFPVTGRWLVKTDTTAGAAQLQLRSEVAASAVTLKAGLSVLMARRLV